MPTRRSRRWPLTLLLPWLLSSAGCFWIRTDHDVLIASEPPGARILVDGEDTGLTTPAMVEWGWWFGSDHEVVLQKEGYHDAGRYLYHHHRQRFSRWVDGSAGVDTWLFPVFWPTSDWVTPIGVRRSYVADEVLVRLLPADEPPLGDGTTWR